MYRIFSAPSTRRALGSSSRRKDFASEWRPALTRLAADARAASGPRGVQRGLLISPRRGPSESEDHADQYADSPERATTATTRDGLTLL